MSSECLGFHWLNTSICVENYFFRTLKVFFKWLPALFHIKELSPMWKSLFLIFILSENGRSFWNSVLIFFINLGVFSCFSVYCISDWTPGTPVIHTSLFYYDDYSLFSMSAWISIDLTIRLSADLLLLCLQLLNLFIECLISGFQFIIVH